MRKPSIVWAKHKHTYNLFYILKGIEIGINIFNKAIAQLLNNSFYSLQFILIEHIQCTTSLSLIHYAIVQIKNQRNIMNGKNSFEYNEEIFMSSMSQ